MRLTFWLGLSDSTHLFQVSVTETNKQTNKQKGSGLNIV